MLFSSLLFILFWTYTTCFDFEAHLAKNGSSQLYLINKWRDDDNSAAILTRLIRNLWNWPINVCNYIRSAEYRREKSKLSLQHSYSSKDIWYRKWGVVMKFGDMSVHSHLIWNLASSRSSAKERNYDIPYWNTPPSKPDLGALLFVLFPPEVKVSYNLCIKTSNFYDWYLSDKGVFAEGCLCTGSTLKNKLWITVL